MTREKKLMLNSASSLAYQLITIICGFILPRYFLIHYGSEVNGLVSSITQFLGFISLAECGVGAVVQSALYRPLADNNMMLVSRIILASERFFKKIAYFLIGYVFLLMVIYPRIITDTFEYHFSMLLILIVSISSFAQYYVGMTYRLLLNADQLGFVYCIIHAIALILNTVLCVALMKIGASIHVVKLATALIFVIQPITLSAIANKHYRIDRTAELVDEPIKQKWNGLSQHIATVVLGNTDTVVLTLLSSLNNVSVYAVYHLIINGVKQMVVASTNGMQAMMGNMLARNEIKELNRSFDNIEWVLHTLVTFVFSVTAVLIIPFVRIYTAGVTDTDYIVPLFAYLLTFAHASYCLRLPYNMMVLAAGHYKQTQKSAIMEAAINIVVSVLFVYHFDLVGVAIGTLAAMTYRTIYLAYYLKKNILYRKLYHFVKHILADACSVLLLLIIRLLIPSFYMIQQPNYLAWFVLAVKVGLTATLVSIFVNSIFYKQKIKEFLLKRRKMKIGKTHDI